MGREIVYCEGCGERLTEDDFTRGKAQDHDGRPFCSRCRPVTPETPPPPPPPPSERRTGTSVVRRRGATERVPLAQPVPSTRRAASESPGSRVGLYVAAGLAFLVLAVIAVMTNRREEPAPLPVPENRPSPAEVAQERLRELEAAKAREQQKQKERDAELDRALAAIRKIIGDDPGYQRRAEVDRLLAAALKDAGPRAAEVQKVQSDYRALCEDDAKRKAAAAEAKKAPPKSWIDLFGEATKKIQANDYPGAKALYLEGLATLPKEKPEDLQHRAHYCIGLYNLACVYAVESAKLADKARSQAVDNALKYLELALRGDYGRFRCPCHPQTLGIGHMADDKDMDPIRKEARYGELIKKYK